MMNGLRDQNANKFISILKKNGVKKQVDWWGFLNQLITNFFEVVQSLIQSKTLGFSGDFVPQMNRTPTKDPTKTEHCIMFF